MFEEERARSDESMCEHIVLLHHVALQSHTVDQKKYMAEINKNIYSHWTKILIRTILFHVNVFIYCVHKEKTIT